MVDFTAEKEYSYEYEAGKIVRATECNLDIENEHILRKSVVNTIKYYYDAQGNPISYLGHTLTWEKGRQLKQFVKADGTSISYTYNANGIRTSKTVNGIKHTYTLDGTKILREEWAGNTIVPLM